MEYAKHLIIGAGPAGLSAAQAIRSVNQTATITLVTREEVPPYSPALLPYLLSNEVSQNGLFLKGKNVLASLNIGFQLGKEVREIRPEANEVVYSDGEREPYSTLLIATGAKPQIPPVQRLKPDQIHTFRTFADYQRLRSSLGRQRKIAIYGAGLVAVELAEKLCLEGYEVTIVARSSLLRKYFSRTSIERLTRIFKEHNGDILAGGTLVSVETQGDHLQLLLSTGETLEVDQLVIATGVEPNRITNGLLPVVEGGLQVGKRMETALPNVYAAGDVAAAPSFADGRHGVCPILPEAVLQGRVAGTNMAGADMEYPGWISANYLRCFDDVLFTIGVTADPDRAYYSVERKGDSSYLKLVFKDECLIGAEGLNLKFVHTGVFLSLIRERVSARKHEEMLLAKPQETSVWLMAQHRKGQAV
jgi:phenylglyoxylate dehydrogenase epsilon subunit